MIPIDVLDNPLPASSGPAARIHPDVSGVPPDPQPGPRCLSRSERLFPPASAPQSHRSGTTGGGRLSHIPRSHCSCTSVAECRPMFCQCSFPTWQVNKQTSNRGPRPRFHHVRHGNKNGDAPLWVGSSDLLLLVGWICGGLGNPGFGAEVERGGEDVAFVVRIVCGFAVGWKGWGWVVISDGGMVLFV